MKKHEPDKLRLILRRLLKENKLSVNGWAKRASISEGALRHFLNGDKNNITYATLYGLARAVGLTIEELICGGTLHPRPLPIQAELPCPETAYGKLHPVETVEWAKATAAMVALRLKDSSMSRVASAGSVVIVDRVQNNPVYLDGKAVVAEVAGQLLCRTYCSEPLQLLPASLNDAAFPPITLVEGEWHILGKVVGVVSYLSD